MKKMGVILLFVMLISTVFAQSNLYSDTYLKSYQSLGNNTTNLVFEEYKNKNNNLIINIDSEYKEKLINYIVELSKLNTSRNYINNLYLGNIAANVTYNNYTRKKYIYLYANKNNNEIYLTFEVNIGNFENPVLEDESIKFLYKNLTK